MPEEMKQLRLWPLRPDETIAGQPDPLTGLRLRRDLLEALEGGRLHAGGDNPLGCVAFDVDGMRRINDSGGRVLGDEILKTVASRLQDAAQDPECVIRSGPDEFLVLVPGHSLLETWLWAIEIKQRIEASLSIMPVHDQATTLSGGVVSFPARDLSIDLLDLADGALSMAREQRPGEVVTWDWVEIDSALRATQIRGGGSPEIRRQRFIDQCSYLLGPTQHAHLTDHCQLTSELAEQLGRHLLLDGRTLRQLQLAGLMHDLGKCVIPEELLARPRSLSHREWQLLTLNAEIGSDFARRLGVDATTAESIRLQHRRFDTSDRQESGNQIPIGARVIAVADALASMIGPRAYGRSLGEQEALAELQRENGKQFDPSVVAAAQRMWPLSRGAAA